MPIAGTCGTCASAAIQKNHLKCNSFKGEGVLYTHFHRNYEYKVQGIVAL